MIFIKNSFSVIVQAILAIVLMVNSQYLIATGILIFISCILRIIESIKKEDGYFFMASIIADFMASLMALIFALVTGFGGALTSHQGGQLLISFPFFLGIYGPTIFCCCDLFGFGYSDSASTGFIALGVSIVIFSFWSILGTMFFGNVGFYIVAFVGIAIDIIALIISLRELKRNGSPLI